MGEALTRWLLDREKTVRLLELVEDNLENVLPEEVCLLRKLKEVEEQEVDDFEDIDNSWWEFVLEKEEDCGSESILFLLLSKRIWAVDL